MEPGSSPPPKRPRDEEGDETTMEGRGEGERGNEGGDEQMGDAVTPLSEGQQPVLNREQRTVQACSRCRRLKSKCIRPPSSDDSLPASTSTGNEPAGGTSDPCRGCRGAGVPCVFDGPKRRGPSRENSMLAGPSSSTASWTAQPSFTYCASSASLYPSPSSISPHKQSFPPPIPNSSFGALYGRTSSNPYQQQQQRQIPPRSMEGRVVSLELELARVRSQVDHLLQSASTTGPPPPFLRPSHRSPISPTFTSGIPLERTGFPHGQHTSSHPPRHPYPPLDVLTSRFDPSPPNALPPPEHRSLPPTPSQIQSQSLSPRRITTSDGIQETSRTSRNASEGGSFPSARPLEPGHATSFLRAGSPAGSISEEGSEEAVSDPDLITLGLVDYEAAKVAIEFYISDLALHTPYITFLPSPVTDEQITLLRRSSTLLFNATVTIGLRALDQNTYNRGIHLVRRAVSRFIEEKNGGESLRMTVDDLKGLVLFSIWHADFALSALSVQAAHNLGLHTAMARYLRLEDVQTREGAALMDLSRLYATVFIHDHLLQIPCGNPALIGSSISALWQQCCERSANQNGVDSYITAYALVSDLLAEAQRCLFDGTFHPIETSSGSPTVIATLTARLEEAKRLKEKMDEWHRDQHASDSLITIVPISFATVYLFSPISYEAYDWSPILATPEGARQINEATEKSEILLTLLLKLWRTRPMLSYTLSLHHFILGLSVSHLLARIFCSPFDPTLHPHLIDRLQHTLQQWTQFGLDTEDCLLRRILLELVGSGERRNSGWEELKGLRWGREMWNGIVPRMKGEE